MKKTPSIKILVGLPGQGKSTLAERLCLEKNTVKISRDDIRMSLKNGYVIDNDLESLVTVVQDAQISTILSKKKYDIVLDNTHCKVAYIKDVINKFGKNAVIEIIPVNPLMSLEEIYSSNKRRDKAVPESVIDRMRPGYLNVIATLDELRTYAKHIHEEGHPVNKRVYNTELPDCIIVDIDGTVAHHDNLRSPFDWQKVVQDRPDPNVISIIETLSNDFQVIFLSGRDSICRNETEQWIRHNYGCFEPYFLYMRPQGDYRKDNIVKKELFQNHIEGIYNPVMVFDDRNQVVDMWRDELNLKCAQVEKGDF